MNRLRVVLNANVLAPGLVSVSSASAEIVRFWRTGLFDLLVTGKLVEEVAHTLDALGLDDGDIRDIVEILGGSNPDLVIPLKHQRMGCIDPNDDYLFETAFTGEAAIVVSRDRNVLSLPVQLRIAAETAGIRVMSDVDFLHYLRRSIFSPLAFDDSCDLYQSRIATKRVRI